MQTLSQKWNTNDLYIHYMDKNTGTPTSLEEKTNKFLYLNLYFHLCCNKVLKCMKWLYPYVQVIGVWD